MNTEWEEVARRGENHNLLMIDLVMAGYLRNDCGRTFGEGVEFVPRHYRQFAGARWFSREDGERYVSLLRQALDEGRLLAIGEAYERRIRLTRELAEKARGRDFAGFDNAGLVKEFEWFYNECASHWGHAYHYIFLNRFLPDEVTAEVASRVPDLEEQTKCLLTLFASDKPTETREESIALIALAEGLKARGVDPLSPAADAAIASHLSRYAHLGMYYFRSLPYSRGQIAQRVAHITGAEISQKKEEFASQENNAQETEALVKRFGLPEATVEKIRVIKQFAFDSNFSDECFNYFIYCHRPLLNEICRRLGCSWNELASMQGAEIIAAIRSDEPLADSFKAVLRERFKDHAIILENGEVRVLVGKPLEEYYAVELKEEESLHHLKEFRGTSASPGKASGRVAVIATTRELDKVRKGDVLVTANTTPEFVPAMQRACAIVTDDGGVLCHAAIVSRELHIPCVVGTKVATKALKDGDLVEVDATNGVIRKVTA